MSGSPKSSFWERLDLPVKVMGGVVALVATALGAYVAVAGNPFAHNPADAEAQTNPAAVAARQVEKCMHRHDMASPHVMTGSQSLSNHFSIERCEWPPVTTTAPDGYTNIVDGITSLPKPSSSLYNIVERLRAPCDDLSATFVHDFMGVRLFVSRRLQAGRAYLVAESGPNVNRSVLTIKLLQLIPEDVANLVPLPSSTTSTFFALHTDHIGLFDARCA
jgi:hypothetical protein